MSTSGGGASNATQLPPGATQVAVSSGNQANAAAVATLPGVAGKTTYLTGFEITAAGATAGLAVTVTVTGTATTLSYTFTYPTGAAVGALPFGAEFLPALAASAPNTAIVVTLPASGAGGTNAAVTAHGYQL